MTCAKLRPYLRLIPLFSHLSRDELSAVAGKLVARRLVGGETLDLRGSYANVLCIVAHGRVKAETCLDGKHILRSELSAGQWAGETLVIGRSQATRTRLTAHSRNAEVLLLWQRDLGATPVAGRLVTSARFSSVSPVLENVLGVLTRKITEVWRFLSSKALKYPVVAGTLISLVLFAGFLLFTQPGRTLRADWKCLRTMQQAHLSQERRSRQLSDVLHLVPDHPLGMVALGNLASQSGNFDAAMLRFAEVASENGAGANNLGLVLLMQGDLASALHAFQLSAQMEPDIAVTYQNLGIVYQQLGQQSEAVRAFKEALRIDPDLAIARYHLGMHYLSQGNLVEAGAAFGRVLEQDATCAPAYTGLGLVHAAIGDLQGATRAFRQATQLEPDSVTAQFYLGWTLSRMGDEAGAETALAQVLALHPPGDLVERVNTMLGGGANNTPEEAPMDDGP
ncbi:MAG TPA: tetratricopeptide repeat protein [Chloroflexi bacterium]|nr:tetratricopeptide repeat protein [Chloroflexota bacterium]